MQIRVLLVAGATALVAASCAPPEPQVLSEAPRSASATEVASPTRTTERDEQLGKFIARCATEADGGTPGLTIFTDGSQNVTDHCLSRYYIGVQPAPGALYVPDEEAGTYAPSNESAPIDTTAQQWTPAQPRTDVGPQDDRDLLAGGEATGQPDDSDSGQPPTVDPGAPTTPTDGTSPTTPPTTGPGGTEPGETGPTAPGTSVPGTTTPGTTTPGTTTPGTTTPGTTAPGETVTEEPGSSEQAAVPTVTEAPQDQQPGPLTSVMSTEPSGSFGSGAPAEPPTSVGFPAFRWPGSFWPGGPQA